MIEKLQENQRAITSRLEDLTLLQQLPHVQSQQFEQTKLPIDYKPAMMEKSVVAVAVVELDADAAILTKYELPLPKQLFHMSNDNDEIINQTMKKVGVISQELGRQKGVISK